MVLPHVSPRRFVASKDLCRYVLWKVQGVAGFSAMPAADDSSRQSNPSEKPSSLSARLSFIFDQIDEIDKKREEKDQTLQRIRAWRESRKQTDSQSEPVTRTVGSDSTEELKPVVVKTGTFLENGDGKKEVELVHPWPEWIELMERLVQQNYFDHRRRDEDGMIESLGFSAPDVAVKVDKEFDFSRDYKTVQTAMVNFGRDRFDILRALPRHDLQLLVGYGCPSTDKRAVYSGKLLRKYTHLDEGDVCSSCSLRGSCEKAYLLTNKEDEARTIDVMRILLSYGFDPKGEFVSNKDLLKMKPVKAIVRKLLHQVVKLSAVPIDPTQSPPVVKKPPPKVKQPPPTPKKRIGRYDVEMKKGDWLCTKCDFLNFAKNTNCLQCEAKRPKRQLLPGEWECPQCNFLNYRRNTVCFHCEHKRPADSYIDQYPEKPGAPGTRTDKIPDRAAVSNAWNFDFDDDESDGADVAAFEYADSQRMNEDFPLTQPTNGVPRGHDRGSGKMSRDRGNSEPVRFGMGFNDFDEDDDDDVDSYELVGPNEAPRTPRVKFSDIEDESESEDDSVGINEGGHGKDKFPGRGRRTCGQGRRDSEGDDLDFGTDDDLPMHPNWKSSHVANPKKQSKRFNTRSLESEDLPFNSDSDDEEGFRSRRARNGRSSKESRHTRGRHPSSSFSETDSDDDDDDFKLHNNKQRRGGGSGRISGSRHHGGKTDSYDDDADFKHDRNKPKHRGGSQRFSDRPHRGAAGRRTTNGEPPYRRQSPSFRDTRASKFDGRGSFQNRGGRSSTDFGSDIDDERHRRPRINVR